MRSTPTKDSRPRRRHGKGSIGTLMTLLAIAAGALALVPVSAVALDDVNGGLGCRPGMNLPPGLGLNEAGEFCSLEPGGEVIVIEDTAPEPEPEPDVEPCLETEDCVPPEIDDPGPTEKELEPARPEEPRGGGAELSLDFCGFWMKAFRDHKRELHDLKLERQSQLDALRVVRGWKNLEPSDGKVSELRDLRPRALEEAVRKKLKELRSKEKELKRKLDLVIDALKFNRCSADVM